MNRSGMGHLDRPTSGLREASGNPYRMPHDAGIVVGMQITHLTGTGLVAAVIRSVGARHEGAHELITDGLYLDLRHALRNPADNPELRHRTGLDGEVRAHVVATPGAVEIIARTAVQLRALADETPVGRGPPHRGMAGRPTPR